MKLKDKYYSYQEGGDKQIKQKYLYYVQSLPYRNPNHFPPKLGSELISLPTVYTIV